MSLERALAPDVTESEVGRKVVATMADGIEWLMLDRGIPFTDQGFEEVVRMSRENGMQGLIAYMKNGAGDRLKVILGEAFGPMVEGVLANVMTATPAVDVRSRLAGSGVTVDVHGKLSEDGEEFFRRVVDTTFGPQARSMLLPIVYGDCQRRLVFEELKSRHPQS